MVTVLEAHPHVACLGEIYNTQGGTMRRLGIRSPRMVQLCTEEPLKYLAEVTRMWTEREDAKPVFGFKMMLHHAPSVLEHIVSDPDWKIILLRRHDVLAQWSSLQIAKRTGEWGNKKKLARAKAGIEEPAVRVQFKAKAFERYTDKLASRYDALTQRLSSHKVLEVTTEQIDARRHEIFTFLGVDPRLAAPPANAGELQNPRSLAARFTNYDAVVRYAQERGIAQPA